MIAEQMFQDKTVICAPNRPLAVTYLADRPAHIPYTNAQSMTRCPSARERKRMKRPLAILLVLLAVLALVACGGATTAEPDADPGQPTAAVATLPAETPTAGQPTAAPTK